MRRQEWQQEGGCCRAGFILVVPLHPFHDLVLVAAFRREVEVVVDAEHDVAAARVRRIGVEDVAVFVLVEDADAGQLVEAVLLVDPFIIVVELARSHLLVGERHMVVEVEVASVGRGEIELPAHALPVGLEVGKLAARDRDERDVVIGEVHIGAVNMVDQQRAALAALAEVPPPHEVVDDELAVVAEQLGQRLLSGRGVEHIVLFDLHPGQLAPFGAHHVAHARQRLLVLEMRLARFDPRFA